MRERARPRLSRPNNNRRARSGRIVETDGAYIDSKTGYGVEEKLRDDEGGETKLRGSSEAKSQHPLRWGNPG